MSKQFLSPVRGFFHTTTYGSLLSYPDCTTALKKTVRNILDNYSGVNSFEISSMNDDILYEGWVSSNRKKLCFNVFEGIEHERKETVDYILNSYYMKKETMMVTSKVTEVENGKKHADEIINAVMDAIAAYSCSKGNARALRFLNQYAGNPLNVVTEVSLGILSCKVVDDELIIRSICGTTFSCNDDEETVVSNVLMLLKDAAILYHEKVAAVVDMKSIVSYGHTDLEVSAECDSMETTAPVVEPEVTDIADESIIEDTACPTVVINPPAATPAISSTQIQKINDDIHSTILNELKPSPILNTRYARVHSYLKKRIGGFFPGVKPKLVDYETYLDNESKFYIHKYLASEAA